MLHEAWNRVSSETIQNCCKKRGFTISTKSVDGEAAGRIEPEYEAEGALEILPTPPGMNAVEFQRWIDIDTDVQAVGETTDAEATKKLVAKIIVFDSKEKEQANNEDENEDEEDKKSQLQQLQK